MLQCSLTCSVKKLGLFLHFCIKTDSVALHYSIKLNVIRILTWKIDCSIFRSIIKLKYIFQLSFWVKFLQVLK